MNAEQEGERRNSSRHEVSLQLVVRELVAPGIGLPSTAAIHGETRNISGGGFCALLDQACHDSALLQCEILMAGYPVAIPTLVQVRWVQNNQQKCLAGLEFLVH
jgi:hypothetical protein